MSAGLENLEPRLDQWLTIRRVGIILLVLAAVGGVLGYQSQHPGQFDFRELVADLYDNVVSDLASVGITILLIDALTRRRGVQGEREQLIRQMASRDNGIALGAVEELRARGWLENGTLEGAYLLGADLREANLVGADLRRTDLSWANLRGANLVETKLQGASLSHADLRGILSVVVSLQGVKLTGANLKDAHLLEANLEGADMEGANLQGASLFRAYLRGVQSLTDEQLAQAKALHHAIMPDGSQYDGRFNLPGDIEGARRQGIDPSDPAAMAYWYGTSLDAYQSGQAWAAEHLPRLRREADRGDGREHI